MNTLSAPLSKALRPDGLSIVIECIPEAIDQRAYRKRKDHEAGLNGQSAISIESVPTQDDPQAHQHRSECR
jgi:hypothetical protein